MHQGYTTKLRRLLLHGVYMLGVLGIVASGGGSGGSDGPSVTFPTPTLPANATVFDAMNANAIARSALGFTTAFPSIAGKLAAPRPIGNIIKAVTDPITRRDRNSQSVVTGINPACTSGSFTSDLEDSGDEVEGTITYSNCEVFGFPGIFLTGEISVYETYDDDAGTYDFQIGGTLTLTDGIDTVTVVLNVRENGNENTGDFSDNISFSIEGIPDETYLVTTAVDIVGNFFSFDVTSGQLIVHGGGGTQLRLDVVPGNLVDVYLDTGGGPVYHSSVDLTTL